MAEGQEPVQLFREALAQGTATILDGFKEGVHVTTLVSLRSKLVDTLLITAWDSYIPQEASVALVAVGGYGRGELHPASDIDLMILLEKDLPKETETGIEQFLTFLWDIGLEVGHSVRTTDECVNEATQDITVATNIMESRLLTGAKELFYEMRTMTSPDKIWPSDLFLTAKWEEQKQRYEKYDDTSNILEPNIKESPGGLRDIQTIGWVTKRYFGCETMHGLVGHHFLTEAEYDALMLGRSLLWKIRFALHSLTGRHEDRLLFNYQHTLAEQFGFVDRGHDLAVEQFMQQYYRTVIRLRRLNERLLQLFNEAIIRQNQPEKITPINQRFQNCDGFIEITDKSVFRNHPCALLEIFLLLQQHPELQGVRASTVRMIRANRHRINDEFRADPQARSLFMEILRQPNGISRELRRMNRYGILAAYLPLFGKIVGRMQYDLFHVYTVDAHTLFVVRNLRRFAIPKYAHESPLCSEIMEQLYKPELLYLAGLFHDIAKGRGGDHSTLGAQDAMEFCQQHGVSCDDSNLVSWLVEKHLTMSITTQRRDISDPEVVHMFAQEVGDLKHLDYLYLLTVADIRATDPKKWNSWKDSLLRELYHATKRALLRGLQYPQNADELIQEKQSKAYRLLEEEGVEHEAIHDQWTLLSVGYFLHSSAEEIAWHTKTVLQTDRDSIPKVTIRRKSERGCSEIFIYSHDRDGLFALTTALLDGLGLNIVDARIETADDSTTRNGYSVLEENGEIITSAERIDEIVARLEDGLRDPERVDLNLQRHIPRQLKHFSVPTEITFTPDSSNKRTIMKLVAWDRPGLLAQVGQVFADCKVSLHNARISTFGAEATDTFFLTDYSGNPLEDESLRECLRQGITQRLAATQPDSD
jgi:[protein-PII] uridylyltransferase